MGLMPTYPNGFVPRDRLVVFATGHDSTGRYYEWRLPPSSYRKHLALVARAKNRTGRTLTPSRGWSCDRPYAEQVYARQIHGIGAAKPGTSSHGGCWAGPVTGWRLVDTAAIDYGNWAWVYENHGGRDAFFADCRAVGLTPGAIARPDFPDEWWHVIDLTPWAAIPAGSEDFEEDDMPTADEVAKAVWNYAIQAQDENGKYIPDAAFPARGFLSSASAQAAAANTSAKAAAGRNIAREVWSFLIRAQNPDGTLISPAVEFPASGFLASTNSQVADVDYVKLAAAIVAAGGVSPTAEQIAKAVNDDQAKRLAS